MNPEYQEQLQQLQQIRRSLAGQGVAHNASSAGLGQWQQHEARRRSAVGERRGEARAEGPERADQRQGDPMIFPGLYAPSGFDMLGILIRVRSRPNPVFDLGFIDSSVALVLCDTALLDSPVVYCSEPFENLTGYATHEVLDRNCRFLQDPHPSVASSVAGKEQAEQLNQGPRAQLRRKIEAGEEAQVRLVNYTKAGVTFFNVLTTIPIVWTEGEVGKRYVVGFQAQDMSTVV